MQVMEVPRNARVEIDPQIPECALDVQVVRPKSKTLKPQNLNISIARMNQHHLVPKHPKPLDVDVERPHAGPPYLPLGAMQGLAQPLYVFPCGCSNDG